jgi:glucose-1-phosphate thymidylyltransferase
MKENYIKGVLLAGGTGSRLGQLTRVTNKHLLPIYNKPMIFYPLSTLIDLGIKEILIVTSIDFCGHISQLLGSGKEYNVEFSYKVQDEAGGIAQALSLAENFSCGSNVNVILGDNIFSAEIQCIIRCKF